MYLEQTCHQIPREQKVKEKPEEMEPPCSQCGRTVNVLLKKGIIKKKMLEDILVLLVIPPKQEHSKPNRQMPAG